jgi:hypothetical protein
LDYYQPLVPGAGSGQAGIGLSRLAGNGGNVSVETVGGNIPT